MVGEDAVDAVDGVDDVDGVGVRGNDGGGWRAWDCLVFRCDEGGRNLLRHVTKHLRAWCF